MSSWSFRLFFVVFTHRLQSFDDEECFNASHPEGFFALLSQGRLHLELTVQETQRLLRDVHSAETFYNWLYKRNVLIILISIYIKASLYIC